MPNSFAYIALIAWPFITILLFRRLQAVPAVFWTILGGYMLLPVRVNFDFPLIPPLDKVSISSIMALIGCIYIKKENISFIPKHGLVRYIVIIIICLPFVTITQNLDPVYDGKFWIAGLNFHDGMSATITQYIELIPFIIAIQIVKTEEDLIKLFKILILAGLFYSIPILMEVRLSPQLHTWIYGFFPHSWVQQLRMDGYRPVVFMGHGLLVAFFITLSFTSAIALWKTNDKTVNKMSIVTVIYLLFMMILSKSMGAYILSTLSFLLICYSPIPLMKRTIQFITILVLAYPYLSIAKLFPHNEILEIIAEIDIERAQSLGYRFYHENKLLTHSEGNYFFGWGGWGRNRLYDSVTDGYWILVLGIKGLVGFSFIFGLIALSIYKGIRYANLIKTKTAQRFHYALILIVTMILTDQIPNSSITGYMWFLIGSIIGITNQEKTQQPLTKSSI